MALTQRLQLTMEEYCELWEAVVEENFRRCLSDDIVNKELGLNDEKFLTYSFELACVVLFMMKKAMKNGPSFNEKAAAYLQESVVKSMFLKLSDAQDGLSQCKELVDTKCTLFSEACVNITNKEKKKRDADLIGLARYLVSSVAQEEEHIRAIELISVNMISAWELFSILMKKTMIERQMSGKFTFLVAH